jgi:amino acid permease
VNFLAYLSSRTAVADTRDAKARADHAAADTFAVDQDRHLHRSLGCRQLTAIGFSEIIGSGWLLGAMYAAQAAGPESLFAWVLGLVVLGLIAGHGAPRRRPA